MFGAVYLAMMLFRVLVVIIAVMAIIISVSKNKLRTIFGIDIAILIFTVLFFFVWFPVKENTVLNLKNGYSVSTEYNEAIAEVFYVNADFDLIEDEKNKQEEMKEIDKKSGYFIINSKEQTLHLTEEQVKEKLKIKKVNLKNPKKIIRKYGEKKELSTFYKIAEDYFLPKKIGATAFNVIKYVIISLLILVAVYLKKRLNKKK